MSFPLDQVNVGAAPNDGTGDDLRQAFQKVNELINRALFGGVVDVGSNANGSYIRLAAGIQICWFEDAATTTATNPTGGVYYAASKVFTFPKPFTSSPHVVPRARRAGEGAVVWAALQTRGATNCSIYAVASSDNTPGFLGYFAIGPWDPSNP